MSKHRFNKRETKAKATGSHFCEECIGVVKALFAQASCFVVTDAEGETVCCVISPEELAYLEEHFGRKALLRAPGRH